MEGVRELIEDDDCEVLGLSARILARYTSEFCIRRHVIIQW